MDPSTRPSTAQEVRSKTQTTEVCPFSGLTYRFRYFTSRDAMASNLIPRVREIADVEKLSQEDIRKYAEEVIQMCCIEPRITLDEKQSGDDVLHISEIGEDWEWLADQIMTRWHEQLGKSPAAASETTS